MIFKIANAKEVQIDKTAPPSATYADFLADLPNDDARYAVLNFEYTQTDGKRSKIVFFLW